MDPKRFLLIGGSVLVTAGTLGITGLFGRISSAAFFHPPSWINWVHLFFGLFLLASSVWAAPKWQSLLALGGAVAGLTLGLGGFLLGGWAAGRFNMPELADATDHFAHLLVGVLASAGSMGRRVASEDR